jgi:EAL and modified HD-GYP domain-containing signal transduction protein
MELLAQDCMPPEEADQAFVTGIFSLLDVMLGMPMDEALKLLSVPEPVADALQHRRGPLGELLTLAEACESNDDAAFDRTAATLHLSSQQINFAHLQALAWVDHLIDT